MLALHMSAFDPKRTLAEISVGPQPNTLVIVVV